MTGLTLLHRQVHPSFMRAGRVTSQAFRPTPKDKRKLSVYDGDIVTAAEAWDHFTTALGLVSVGVVAVNVAECAACSLAVTPDPLTFRAHVLIDFTGLTENDVVRKGKVLAGHAVDRGWLYTPVGNP